MCQQIDYAAILIVRIQLAILIVRDVAFCVKVLIHDKFKISFNQNNIFRNIPL